MPAGFVSSKVISYALWAVVLIRLLCPVSIESGLSLFGLFDTPTVGMSEHSSAVEYIPSNIVHTEFPEVVLIVCIILAVCLLTNPEEKEQDLSFLNYKNLPTLAYQTETLDCIYPDAHGVANGSIEGKLLGDFLNEAVWKEMELRDPYKLEPDIQISFDSELHLGFSKHQPKLAI